MRNKGVSFSSPSSPVACEIERNDFLAQKKSQLHHIDMPSVSDLEESNSELPGAYSNIGLTQRFSEVDAKTEAKR